MGKINSERRESAWLTVRQLADALDVTTAFVRTEVIRRIPADMIRRDVRPMRIYARGAIEAWLKGTVTPNTGVWSIADDLTDLDLTNYGEISLEE